MNEADALEVVRNALWTVIIASGPAVVAAMAIGVVIALFQALTQVQEVTLTFVPKILAVIFVVTVAAPFIGEQVFSFTQQVYSRIETGFTR